MITVLTFIKSEISKGEVHPNDWNDIDTVLDVKIHEAIMTFDREVLKIKLALHAFLIILEVQHIDPCLSILDAVENGELRSGDESLHLYWILILFLRFFKVSLVHLNH